jgi:hypothetical protein
MEPFGLEMGSVALDPAGLGQPPVNRRHAQTNAFPTVSTIAWLRYVEITYPCPGTPGMAYAPEAGLVLPRIRPSILGHPVLVQPALRSTGLPRPRGAHAGSRITPSAFIPSRSIPRSLRPSRSTTADEHLRAVSTSVSQR